MSSREDLAFDLRNWLAKDGGLSEPVQAFGRMLEFYSERRVTDALPLEEDGDMLLYQSGVYDWGEGARMQISLTR